MPKATITKAHLRDILVQGSTDPRSAVSDDGAYGFHVAQPAVPLRHQGDSPPRPPAYGERRSYRELSSRPGDRPPATQRGARDRDRVCAAVQAAPVHG